MNGVLALNQGNGGREAFFSQEGQLNNKFHKSGVSFSNSGVLSLQLSADLLEMSSFCKVNAETR